MDIYGGAIEFEQAQQEYRGIAGRFVTVAGIDSDPEACQDFESLTYGQDHNMNLFSYNDYTLFHSKQPPRGFKLPTHMRDGRPLQLAGKSDTRWRDRIGKVPPPTAKAIAEVDLKAKLMSIIDAWELSHTKIWVCRLTSVRMEGLKGEHDKEPIIKLIKPKIYYFPERKK